MQTNFLPITDFTQEQEGLYQCLRSDGGNWTGGAVGHGMLVGTMRGISAPTMVRWMGGNPAAVTCKVMQSIDVPTARAISRAFYWRPLNCDLLSAGIDAMTFDFGFNVGIRVAACQLQTVVGLKGEDVDGDIGPRTVSAVMDAIATSSISSLIERLTDMQTAFYQVRRLFAACGHDWIARTYDRRTLAFRLAQQSLATA
ncbi:hypothetical protein Geu3261_0144_031 [Komagataeibacter europaeus NBRC 3261]|uniref:Uncharacterized protein n=1 Tax=Komagataeibacter europaeus NBRC 3261 TaxID=1234669 RepID=A0A0D6Q144_KOMEU|nr:glycosyl hydrolase 108 family protein [Komagataeibacter europaeus]GAN97159.1 hypothetical protein Geu3261_0144_031 [Komagataeibacter europaeus NBRC 3261]